MKTTENPNLANMTLVELAQFQLAIEAEQRRRRIAAALKRVGELHAQNAKLDPRVEHLQTRLLREVRTTRRYIIIDDCLEQIEIILDI